MVDHHTHHLLCQCFTILHQQTVTHYCIDLKLIAEEASNLSHLRQLATCTSTFLVLLGDRALLHPHTGNCPQGHLLDLAAAYIPALCSHFPTWAIWNPSSWPHHTLE